MLLHMLGGAGRECCAAGGRLKKMEEERMKEASGDALDKEAKDAKAKRRK